MNLQQATTMVSTMLGFRGDLTSRIGLQFKAAQDLFEQGPEFPWFLLTENATTQTSDTDRRVSLPGDFIAEYEEGALFFQRSIDDDLIELEKEDHDYLLEFYGSTAKGEPKAYSIDGSYFNIFPKPDALYTLKMKYYRQDVDPSGLTATQTNKWLTHAPNCLIGWAGQNLAIGLRDNVALLRFQALESEGRQLVTMQNETRKHSNRSYQVGGPA